MGDNNTVRKVEKGAEKLAKKMKSAKGPIPSKGDKLGKLDLRIKYELDTLTVHLVQAKGLPALEGRTSDPYAKVYLLQASSPAALFEKGHEQSKAHKKNINPIFNEAFAFKGLEMSTLLSCKLVIAIWDDDLISADDYMCGLRVAMSDILDGSAGGVDVTFSADLRPAGMDGHPQEVNRVSLGQEDSSWTTQQTEYTTGNIRDSSQFSSTSSTHSSRSYSTSSTTRRGTSAAGNTIRKEDAGAKRLSKQGTKSSVQAAKKKHLGKLEIEIKYEFESLSIHLGQAKGLPVKDNFGTSDPYAKVYLLQPGLEPEYERGHEKTKTKKNNLNPVFNETFVFKGVDSTTLMNTKLVIAIWDSDMLTKDEYMCGLRVSMSHFMHDSFFKLWVNLQTHGLDGHPMEISYEALTASTPSSSRQPSPPPVRQPSPPPTTVKKTSRLSATVTMAVSYDPNGFLRLFLVRAQGLPDKDLIGKSDPYAKVYLVDEHGSKFLDHKRKEKTKTKKNDQNPVFQEGFDFKLTLQLIRKMKAVIEVWDDDFGKDQFLAGVMFSLHAFDLSDEIEITINMYSGLNGNMPFEVDNIARFYTTKKSVVQMVNTNYVQRPRSRSSSSSSSASSSSSDDEKDVRSSLRQSNNKLISYIEKARIMAQAYGIGNSIPNEINVEENVHSLSSQEVEVNATNQMLPILHEVQNKVRNARDELERLREKNRRLKLTCEEKQRVLTEKERAIWALEGDIASLQGNITVIKKEFIRIEEVEVSLGREREYYLEQLASAKQAWMSIDVEFFKREINNKQIDMEAQFKQETEQEIEKRVSEVHIPISVYHKFQERMEKELEAKRKIYMKSVGKLQIEYKQILAMYDNIVMAKEKGTIESHRKTSMMEKIGSYRGDMSKIEKDVVALRSELAFLQSEQARKNAEYNIKLQQKHQEFEEYRSKFERDLQAWFENYSEEFKAWCREQVELAIYGKLLEFEEQRLASSVFSAQNTARVTTTKRRTSYNTPTYSQSSERYSIKNASVPMSPSSVSSMSRSSSAMGFSSGGAVMTGQAVSGATYTSQSKARKESGYHSPGTKTPGVKTPDGTLDSRNSGYSDVFQNIKNDMEAEEFHI